MANNGNDNNVIIPVAQEETVNTNTNESGLYTTKSG